MTDSNIKSKLNQKNQNFIPKNKLFIHNSKSMPKVGHQYLLVRPKLERRSRRSLGQSALMCPTSLQLKHVFGRSLRGSEQSRERCESEPQL